MVGPRLRAACACAWRLFVAGPAIVCIATMSEAQHEASLVVGSMLASRRRLAFLPGRGVFALCGSARLCGNSARIMPSVVAPNLDGRLFLLLGARQVRTSLFVSKLHSRAPPPAPFELLSIGPSKLLIALAFDVLTARWREAWAVREERRASAATAGSPICFRCVARKCRDVVNDSELRQPRIGLALSSYRDGEATPLTECDGER